MSDIFEQVIGVVAHTETAYEAAMKRCDEVRRFIQHRQIDRGWHGPLDQAALLAVSQHAMPDGTPLWSAAFLIQQTGTLVQMFLAEKDGTFEKLPPIAVLGSIGMV
jgi:hypothetical protein